MQAWHCSFICIEKKLVFVNALIELIIWFIQNNVYESIDHIIVSQSMPNSIYANNRWTPFGIQIVDVIVAFKDAFAAIFKHFFFC